MTPEEIRELRKRLGLSQEQMGRRLGATLQTVYRWEAGTAKPRGLYLKALTDLAAEAPDPDQKKRAA